MSDNTPDKLSRLVPGIGWRYDTEHNGNRHMRGHDYGNYGTYLITLVVAGRRPLLGTLLGTTRAGGPAPYLDPSPLGRQIVEEEIPAISRHFELVEVWDHCLMPDHMHMIVRVKGRLPDGKQLGNVIGSFKGACTRAWWRLTEDTPSAGGEAGRPSLFEPGFNNRILMEDGQLQHWKGYIADNAFRKVYRQEHPEFMQRVLQVTIGGVRYGAFGNLFLLRYPERHRVFFHRRTRVGGRMLPTEETPFWQEEERRLIARAAQGDVLVTPGISECEKRIKNQALQQHLRLIHLQDTPIRQYWKPESSRFEACMHGTLLILAPWEEDTQPWRGSKSDLFHHLNFLAGIICSPEGVQSLR